MPMARIESGVPPLGAPLTPTAGRHRRGRRDPHHRHGPQGGGGGRPSSRRARSPSAAWPRARRCSPRRWPPCSRCSPPTPRSSPGCTRRSSSRSTTPSTRCSSTGARAPTTPCSCSPTGPPATTPITRGRPARTTRSPRRSPRCATPSPTQMAADAEGATKLARIVVPAPGQRGGAARRAHGRRQSQLVQCSLYGKDPYWGRVLSGARRERRVPRSRAGRHRLQRHHRLPRRRRRPHDETAVAAPSWPRDIEIACDLHQGNGRGDGAFTDLTHAYIDENMGTS